MGLHDKRVAFIGGGNMATSLVSGLVARRFDPERFSVGEPSDERRRSLRESLGVRCEADNAAAVRDADVVLFAVKPQVIEDIARALAPDLPGSCFVITIAAGIRSGDLSRWLGDQVSVIRAMPNTPALISCGITALYAGTGVDGSQASLAEELMSAVGDTLWIDDETLMDAVTAVSGSGPAYLFLFIEALEEAAIDAGLPPETARRLALKTALGAVRMADETGVEPAELRRRVTSPGGTTEAALEALDRGGFKALVAGAVRAAVRRGAELADEAGDR